MYTKATFGTLESVLSSVESVLIIRGRDVVFSLLFLDPHQAQLDAAREEQRLEVQDIEDGDGDNGGDGDGGDGDDGGQPRVKEEPVKLTCGVMLQKEGPDGLIDEKCGIPTPEKMAGLCPLVY